MEMVNVPAGSSIGFRLDNTLYHSGPAAIYLGKAPGKAAEWDGSGARWFKVPVIPRISHPPPLLIVNLVELDCRMGRNVQPI